MKLGIAGTDGNRQITQARFGIAGELNGSKTDVARFGVGGLNDRHIIGAGQEATSGARCAAAGPNTRPIVAGGRKAMGVDALRRRDDALSRISRNSTRLGDRAAREAWGKGCWFADFTYVCTPFQATENGGYTRSGGLRWRDGREAVFDPQHRDLPFFIDSCGYRRELTGSAPQWAMDFDVYPAAIELLQPDGYAAWDYPQDRERTIEALDTLMGTFPAHVHDGRMWPVFSIRWSWDDDAHLSFARLPGWAGRNLASLVPLNRTQKPFREATRERWARQALANALAMADDPDFRRMVDGFGRVMIGGMVGGPCPRMARHVFAAALCALFPDVEFWLLGQANFAVVNGLGMLGLLDRVWTDGTWWIKDATAERMAVVEDGLITMLHLSPDGDYRVQSFFTMVEMMAANLRSLLAAYQGLWSWPPPEPVPVDLLDEAQAVELKERFQAAQLELGL